MAEMFTMIFVTILVVVTGTTTFFVAKGIYNDEHEQIKAHINNQLIINAERDRSHEFSQNVFLVILAIVTAVIALYIGTRCAINAFLKNTSQRQNVQKMQVPAVRQEEFVA